jgi:hypothetical protein
LFGTVTFCSQRIRDDLLTRNLSHVQITFKKMPITAALAIFTFVLVRVNCHTYNCLHLSDGKHQTNEINIPLTRFSLEKADRDLLLKYNCLILQYEELEFFKIYKKFLILINKVLVFSTQTDPNIIKSAMTYFSSLPSHLIIVKGDIQDVNINSIVEHKLSKEQLGQYLRTIYKDNNRILIHQHEDPLNHGSSIKVANFQYPPFTLKSEGSITGVEVNLITAVTKSLKVPVEFANPKDNAMWGQTVG